MENLLREPSREEEMLKRGLKISFFFHVSLAIFVLLKSMVFPDTSFKPYTPSLKVDLVGLPDQLKNETTAAVPLPSEKEDTAPEVSKKAASKPVATPDEMVMSKKKENKEKKKEETHEELKPEKRKAKLSNALARIKALNRITSDSPETTRTSDLVKGNKLSAGNSRAGEAKESIEGAYYDQILERVRQNWSLPVWLSRQKLQSQVQIILDARGFVKTIRFIKPSGSQPFDDAVRAAVKDSEPFPLPPDAIKKNVIIDGILLGFPL